MLRRRYTSIAEEPEGEDNPNTTGHILGKTNKTSNITHINEQNGYREPTKSYRLSMMGSDAARELDPENERLLFFDDEDVFTEEEEDNLDNLLTKETMAGDQAESLTYDAVSSPKSDQGLATKMGLSANQVREIKEAFHVFDVNGDGCISATELKKLVTSLGYNITEAELMDMMNQIDSDGNGAIDFPEFLALMTKNLQDSDPEDMTMESFKVFDRDNSGFIGASELRRVFKILGQDFQDYELEAMIKAADTDGDGLVGYDDFVKMMNLGEN